MSEKFSELNFKEWLQGDQNFWKSNHARSFELELGIIIKRFDGAIDKIKKLKQPPYDLQNDRNDSRMRGYNEALKDVLRILGVKEE